MRTAWINQRWMGYVLALVTVVLALLFRWWLARVTGEWRAPYVTLLPAVMLTAMLAGLSPGLLATALAALAAAFWILPPEGFAIGSPSDAVGLGIFVLMGVFMSVVAAMYHAARQRAMAYQKELVVRQSAEEIRRQKDLLEVTLSSIGDAVIVTDPKGRVSFLNGEAERLTGWTNKDAAGEQLPTVFHIVNEQTRETVESPVDKVLRLGVVVGLANHTILISRDGRQTPIDDSGAPIRDADGAVRGVVLVFRDFSDQKAAEKSLRASEQRYRSLFESMEEGFALCEMIWDDAGNAVDWRYLEVNPAFEKSTGLTAQQVEGRRVTEVIPGIESYWIQSYGRVARSGRGERLANPVATLGRQFEVDAYSPAPGQFAAVFRDVTERMRVEQSLREGEQRYRAIFDNVGVGIIEADTNDRFVAANARVCQILGRSPEQLVGTSVHELTYRDDQAISDRLNAELRGGKTDRIAYDKRYVRGDGLPVWVYVTVSALRDPAGKRLRSIATVEDISQRKAAEEHLTAAKLAADRARAAAEEASKAKDHFMAVLSHELRTPLTPVLATVSMLQERPQFDMDTRESLEMIRRNVELEARLIDDLLDVTRITRGKVELHRKPLDLCAIIQHAVDVCQSDIQDRGLRFSFEPGSSSPYIVDADATRLQQVFWNLLKNAIKFTPPGGSVAIRCRADGSCVVVEVTDSGVGIEAETLPRLFTPFEQGQRGITRQFGGLGLGLTICKVMVEMHGGSIEARSGGKDKGATFIVRLPIVAQPLPVKDHQAPAAAQKSAIASRGLRILLVEDHGDTARIIRRLLIADGHQVQTAGDLRTARQLSHDHEFDLLLSDLGLPDGSGLDLMRELRQRGSVLPGIALSGYGQDQDIAQSREAGFAVHLTKPASLGQLRATIAAVAGHPASADRPA